MRYVTLNGNTDEVAVWKSKEDASRAVLQFDNHRFISWEKRANGGYGGFIKTIRLSPRYGNHSSRIT